MDEVVVSVLMSVYNTDEVFLREAIDSVLKQSFKDFEFLIVDDCSDEKTKQILREYANKDKRIRVITNDVNMGLTKNLNRMVMEAKGKYLARMDADDICITERFMKQVAFLDHHPKIAMVGTWFSIIKDHDHDIIGYRKEAFLPYQIKARLFFYNGGNLHSSMMMRKDVFNQENNLLYDVTKKKAQDYDLWVRVVKNYKIYLLPEVLMTYRISDGQISTVASESQSSYRDMIILSQLKNLVDEPTVEEEMIHLSFCTGLNVLTPSSYVQWGKRIIHSNKKRRCYDVRAFDYYAYTLMIKGIFRSTNKKISMSLCKFLLIYLIVFMRFYFSWGWDLLIGRL